MEGICIAVVLAGAMAMWTPLSHVEETRLFGKVTSFLRCLVYVVNWNVGNPFPRKFFYFCCPHRLITTHVYGKSLEFGPKCHRDLEGEPFYCFHLVLVNALHVGAPMMAQLWDTTTILLKCPPLEFAKLSFFDQVLKVRVFCKIRLS